MSSRIEGDIHSLDELASLRDEVNDAMSRKMEHMNIKASNEAKSNANSNAVAENSSSSKSSKSSKNFDDLSPVSLSAAHKFLNANSQHRKYTAYQRDNSSSSSNGGGGQQCSLEGKDSNLVVDDTNYVNRRKAKKSKSKHTRRRTDLDFRDDTEPPSPTPGPSSRNDFGT